MSVVRIDDCLSSRNGRLFVEGRDGVSLVQEFGSPLFVVSEDQLRRNVRRFQDAFAKGWSQGPVDVMPAVKANWSLAVQRVLAECGCGCDVYSPGELSVALRAGFPSSRISVNGLPKDADHLYRSIQAGVRITIDSVEEVDEIERLAGKLSRSARVRLRLKPVLADFVDASDFAAEGLFPTDLAALAYKGGLAFEDAVRVGRRVVGSKGMRLVGFHQHHGRHHASTRYWAAQMKAFASEVARVCRALGGFQPQELDIGGGFAIPRDPHNAATQYAAPFELAAVHVLSRGLRTIGSRARYAALRPLVDRIESVPRAQSAPTIEEYARVCTQTLACELARHGVATRGITLQLEPGRAIHGNAGVHLATVRNIKTLRDPVRWNVATVDTTEFWMTGGRFEHHLHETLVANKVDAAREVRYDLTGRSCYGDRLLPAVRMPVLEVGDVVAFLDTGAYQEASCSNFNALPRPATVLVTGESATVVRRRETETDVLRREVVPQHLARRDGSEIETEAGSEQGPSLPPPDVATDGWSPGRAARAESRAPIGGSD